MSENNVCFNIFTAWVGKLLDTAIWIAILKWINQWSMTLVKLSHSVHPHCPLAYHFNPHQHLMFNLWVKTGKKRSPYLFKPSSIVCLSSLCLTSNLLWHPTLKLILFLQYRVEKHKDISVSEIHLIYCNTNVSNVPNLASYHECTIYTKHVISSFLDTQEWWKKLPMILRQNNPETPPQKKGNSN